MSDPDYSDKHGQLEKIRRLEREKEQLSLRLWRYERRPPRVVGSFLLLFGAAAILLSLAYTSDLLLYVGLGLIISGTVLIYIRPKRLTRVDLLDSIAFTLILTVGRFLKTLGLVGKGVYLPPEDPEGAKDGLVFIPSQEGSLVPAMEQTEKGLFVENPKGIILTSAGLGLTNLLEKELATSFTHVDVGTLNQKLRPLFREVLRLAEDLKIELTQDLVYIQLEKPVFVHTCKQLQENLDVCSSYGCPVCSSLATILARSTGKPVVIEKTHTSSDGNTLEIVYRILKD